MRRSRDPQRGYALAFVLTVLILLGLGSMLVMYVLTAGIAETRRALGSQRVFYACDSAIRLASRVAESVVLSNPRASASDVTHLAMDSICDAAGGCIGTRAGGSFTAEYNAPAPGDAAGPASLMPGHTVMERFKLRVQPLQSVNTIQTGAFRDLFAVQSKVTIDVQGIHVGTGTVAQARDTFSLATISPFNLMAFSNAPLAWAPFLARAPFVPAGMSVARVGPSVYADGALQLGGGAALNLTRAVATGTITSTANIWNGDLATPLYNPFAAPDGVWSVQIRTPLTLPAQPAKKQSQPPAEVTRSTRWILDPPIFGVGGDNAGAREAKLAMQADIRIIDGVWFIKPPSGSTEPEWPGIPIWSDHIGGSVAPARAESIALMRPPAPATIENIGQEDLRTRHTWPSTPTRFSYYERDAALALPRVTTDLTNTGIVSYGLLKVTATGALQPGAYSGEDSSGGLPCGDDTTIGTTLWGRFISFRDCRYPSSGLIDAARYGFQDANARNAASNARNVLPMNFDVGQFLAALQDGRPGELGSYFCGAVADVNNPADTPTVCRAFNGIVYITATWRGSLNGLINTNATALVPRQGVRVPNWGADVSAIMAPLFPANGFPGDATDPNQRKERYYLPEQLCTGAGTSGAQLEGRVGFHKGFPAVQCGSPEWNAIYDGGSSGITAPQPTVTAVRVVGGRDLSAIYDAVVPLRLGSTQGLSIASNLPVYVQGDWNIQAGAPATSASVCPAPGVTPVPGDCLLPRTMIAGDRVTFLSNPGAGTSPNPGFNDNIASWVVSGGIPLIQARQTTYVTAVMTALSPPTGAPENIESQFRVIERWDYNATSGRPTLKIVGAIHANGRSVYRPDPQAVLGGTVPQPRLDWVYNPSLSTLNQPPGTPRFLVGVSNRWRDLREQPETAAAAP